jgi:hypothetical protein
MASQAPRKLLSEENIDAFLDRLLNDPSFVDDLRSDPIPALRSLGIEPNPDEKAQAEGLAMLMDLDPTMPVEELRQRVAKGGGNQ